MSKRGTLRASDSDRDQIVDRLQRAATEGRIAAEELEQRVGSALKARTYNELDATVADLPRPGSPRTPSHRGRSAGGWALATVRESPWLLLFAIPVLAVTMAIVVAATVVWMVLMIVVMVLGGRRRVSRGPWAYAWQAGPRRSSGQRRSGPGRYWA